MAPEHELDTTPGSLTPILRMGLLIFLGLLTVVVLLAWFLGSDLLPMEYEGFD